MRQGSTGVYFLPEAEWAYLITFVLPDYTTHGPTSVSWRSPNATHMERGKHAVRGWFRRLEKPLKALDARPLRACCVPELLDASGNPTPLHFHALVSRSLAFEQIFGGLIDDVYEQEIWHVCLKKFGRTTLGNNVVSAHIKRINCDYGVKKYIMKNVDDNFNVQNIIDIKYLAA